jgi:hypothetical protein
MMLKWQQSPITGPALSGQPASPFAEKNDLLPALAQAGQQAG